MTISRQVNSRHAPDYENSQGKKASKKYHLELNFISVRGVADQAINF